MKLPSAKWLPFFPGGDELRLGFGSYHSPLVDKSDESIHGTFRKRRGDSSLLEILMLFLQNIPSACFIE